MLATSKVKMSVSEQTSEQEHLQETKSFVRTNDIPSLKRVTRKFYVVAVQQQRQYIYIYKDEFLESDMVICDWTAKVVNNIR